MLLCSSCHKVIANVDPVNTRYGICASCPTPKMKTWKVIASGTDHFETVVEAETKEEAEEKAFEVDDWDYVEDFGDWYIRYEDTEEVKK